MKNQTALEFAKEFINDLKENNYKNNSEYYFDKEILKDDPNLETLKSELKKINFDLTQQNDKEIWTLKKIKGV